MTNDKREKLVFPVALVVLAAWAASLVVGFYTAEYTPLTITTPAMLLLAGYVFGTSLVRRNGA